ncbi:hypothetical protein [Alkalihalobacillus deserti]|nr:hypothetical protein [Alkalihalobacillus deserti]
MSDITVICPNCQDQKPISNLLTAQSNQNIIYKCEKCQYEKKNIQTKKG